MPPDNGRVILKNINEINPLKRGTLPLIKKDEIKMLVSMLVYRFFDKKDRACLIRSSKGRVTSLKLALKNCIDRVTSLRE